MSSGAQVFEDLPLFAADDPVELTIAMDVDAVLSDREEDADDRPATLHAKSDAGESAHGIKVRTRGFYRLKYLDCDVPPIRLNFKKDEVEGTLFQGQDKLKLVTHCQNGSDRYQQYVFQEYHIYRAYNVLTDASFRTRLVHITYVDSRGRRDPIEGYGFLIEDEDLLAERLGGSIVDDGVTIYPRAAQQEALSLMAVFQYMIGNTDWTVSTHHNVKLIFVDSTRTFLAVPYDFDWSGLINTPYATPLEGLDIRSVRERRFMGLCREEEDFDAIFQRFLAVEDRIMNVFGRSKYLESNSAKRSTDYLEDFFETIRSPRGVRREFVRACL